VEKGNPEKGMREPIPCEKGNPVVERENQLLLEKGNPEKGMREPIPCEKGNPVVERENQLPEEKRKPWGLEKELEIGQSPQISALSAE
jgi:hypothetical protein